MLFDFARKGRLYYLLGAVLAAVPAMTGTAAVRPVPPGTLPGVAPVASVHRIATEGIDTAALMAEDAARERSTIPFPTRFAAGLPLSLTPENSGTWESLDDGSRLWRLRIASPDARNLSLGFDRFQLPPGAAVWIHDLSGTGVQGPYTASDRNSDGGLWTAVVLGEELVVELLLPGEVAWEADLRIAQINHGYRGFGTRNDAPAAKRGSCNVNVVCSEGDSWRDQIRSVARITYVGTDNMGYLCTAQLVNNTALDDTPYLLTAQHCIDDESIPPSVVAYWNYETSSCDDFTGGSLSQNQSGSTFVASWQLSSGSDFALVELDQMPNASFNVYYAGWDARDTVPQSATTIHHPSGDEKSISSEADPLSITSYLEDTGPGDGDHLRVADWDSGTTEGGSSGSCLFDDATGLCVGTLSGGWAACANDDPDWFGRMARHFTGAGTSTTRLSDWLDPGDTGVLYLAGKNPGSASETATWLLPAVASRPGVGTSNWKSQISVVNTGTASWIANLYYVPSGDAWPGSLFTGPIQVAPNQSLHLDDPLASANPTAGLMYVTVGGADSAVFSRTYNLADGGATFGQGMPGILLADSVVASELVLPLVHSAPGGFRTNVGFAQASAGSFSVRASLYSADGTLLAEKVYSVTTAWRQINDIATNMGVGDQTVTGGWIRVQLVGGSPTFWTTYATVIDPVTDDPTYVLPQAP